MRHLLALGMVLVSLGLGSELSYGQRDPNARCLLECHANPELKREVAPGQFKSLYVNYEQFKTSVHKDKLCVDCHTDVTAIPHQRRPEQIHCLQCHYQGNVVGAPVSERPEKYKESVHGKAFARGDPNAPDCKNCHTVHDVRTHTDPISPIYRANIPKTCGSCHIEIYTEYLESVHGQALRLSPHPSGSPLPPRGEGLEVRVESAVCSDCHREHDLFPPDDPRSSLHPQNVANTCARCHTDVKIMERRGVPVKQVEAFKRSFHGIAVEFGILKSANCVSCHDYHKILSSRDPRSPIYPLNLAQTCGQCHPNAGQNVARGRFHIIPSDPDAGIVFWVYEFYRWLTIVMTAGFIFYIVLDLYGRWRHTRRGSHG